MVFYSLSMAKKSLKYWRSVCLAENATAVNHYRAGNKKGVREMLTANGYKPCKEGFTNDQFKFSKPHLVEVEFDNTLDLLVQCITGVVVEKELKAPAEAPEAAEVATPPAAAPAA